MNPIAHHFLVLVGFTVLTQLIVVSQGSWITSCCPLMVVKRVSKTSWRQLTAGIKFSWFIVVSVGSRELLVRTVLRWTNYPWHQGWHVIPTTTSKVVVVSLTTAKGMSMWSWRHLLVASWWYVPPITRQVKVVLVLLVKMMIVWDRILIVIGGFCWKILCWRITIDWNCWIGPICQCSGCPVVITNWCWRGAILLVKLLLVMHHFNVGRVWWAGRACTVTAVWVFVFGCHLGCLGGNGCSSH